MNLRVAQYRGQCYDGASNVAGSKHGVAAQLHAEEPRALLTHCYGHALNLAVADTMKQSKVCHDALDTSYEISKLIRFSPKRNAALDHIKIENPAEEESGQAMASVHSVQRRGLYAVMLLRASLTTMRHWRGCGMNVLRPSWNQMSRVASLVSRHRCCATTLCLVCNLARISWRLLTIFSISQCLQLKVKS